MLRPSAIAIAAPTSARCVNACGKFPSWRPATGSYSSARRPTSLRRSSSRSKSSRASSILPLQREHLGEPERARKEHALAGRQAVDGAVLARAVAEDEPVDRQLAPDRLDGRDEALVVGGQEADERHQQDARVELVRAVRLGEGAASSSLQARASTSAWISSRRALASGRPGPRGRTPRRCARRGRTRPTPSPSSG